MRNVRVSRPRRQRARVVGTALAGAALVAPLALSGCGTDTPPGVLGYVEGFSGAVVADEPHAVIIARDILSAGGTAADAATAMALALTVTLPTSASLGGGGVCLVQDMDQLDNLRVEALDFLPATAAGPPGPDGQAVAVPAMPRGLFALHARDGVLRWETVVSPAENLARQGFSASRALAREVQALGGLPMDSSVSAVYGVGMVAEGQRLQALDLARALGQVRVAPGGFYTGEVSRELIASASEAGFAMTQDALRAWTPTWRAAVRQAHSPHWDLFAPVPDSGARVAAQWAGQSAALSVGSGLQLAMRTGPGPVADAGVLLAQSGNDAALDYPDLTGGGASTPATTTAEPLPAAEPVPEPELEEAGPVLLTPAEATEAAEDAEDAETDEMDSAAPVGSEALPGPGTEDPAGTPSAVPSTAPSVAAVPIAPGATSFVVVDSFGGAVACALTANRPFGTGRLLPRLGFAPVPMPGVDAPALAIMLRANTNVDGSLGGFGAVGKGAETLALSAGGAVFLRDATPSAALTQAAGSAPPGARINVVSCPETVPDYPESCGVAVDPRGAGLGMIFGSE
jgi:gamma-glutamyltranspeptidase/glutathione hydrolase